VAINWTDPSKNSPADLDGLRQFIADTDPTVNQSHLYRPKAKPADGTPGSGAQAQDTGTRGA
jgi:hypothetical protein